MPVRLYIEKGIYTNLKTKVTAYGINNALVEIYFVADVNQQLIIPFEKKARNQKYEILISSHFITGKVPNFYGKSFEFSSNIFDIKTKI